MNFVCGCALQTYRQSFPVDCVRRDNLCLLLKSPEAQWLEILHYVCIMLFCSTDWRRGNVHVGINKMFALLQLPKLTYR